VGHVLYAKRVRGECSQVYSDANLSLEQYIRPGTKLEPDTTAVERFSDKIDNKAGVDASVMTFVAKLAGKQAAEVVVSDTTTMIVPDDAIDIPKLQRLADEALQPEECERFFIRGAIVTTITYRVATEVDGSATVSGAAFGANGRIYNAARKYSLDYRLGLTVLPGRRDIKPATPPMARSPAVKPLEGISVPETGLPSR
jgi:hypothetical protein